ncbi:prolyl-tRNA synthetase associated domain-containing protein 1-like [Oscarella lobularis]|uniref:prolyl-tRNA synthetase associated domain-containing protein 1-like n=1 Tax=Oscarella lobularis TaxID=121494 RepID=UPI003313D971
MASEAKGGRSALIQHLDDMKITYEIVEHPPVFTVEEMMPHLRHLEGSHSKNLFLKDKKKKGLWLVTTLAERQINLTELGKKIGAPGGLRFADESIMIDVLNVAQGCCTPLALFNDTEKKVTFVLDEGFVREKHGRVFFHPMVNDATMGLASSDFVRFVESTGHSPVIVNLDE